mmetsp:Transcript_41064/g.93614  ORF Transcript_41064/g.93614 Transcript_41064/m.93614 type:complete len:236 (-) Transcript_41064:111-818(-)
MLEVRRSACSRSRHRNCGALFSLRRDTAGRCGGESGCRTTQLAEADTDELDHTPGILRGVSKQWKWHLGPGLPPHEIARRESRGGRDRVLEERQGVYEAAAEESVDCRTAPRHLAGRAGCAGCADVLLSLDLAFDQHGCDYVATRRGGNGKGGRDCLIPRAPRCSYPAHHDAQLREAASAVPGNVFVSRKPRGPCIGPSRRNRVPQLDRDLRPGVDRPLPPDRQRRPVDRDDHGN